MNPLERVVQPSRAGRGLPENLGLTVPTIVATVGFLISNDWTITWAAAVVGVLLVAAVVWAIWPKEVGSYLLRVGFVLVLGGIGTFPTTNPFLFAGVLIVAYWFAVCMSLWLIFEQINKTIRS
jgi:hypothetical protein